MYLRHNLTEEVLTEAFEVSQSTISKNHPPHRRRTIEATRAESPRARISPEYPRLTGHRRHFDSGVELVFTRENIVFR
ncbi:transposase family protein [Rothia terrae]|nr:transposase family protein [Rothia terrae]